MRLRLAFRPRFGPVTLAALVLLGTLAPRAHATVSAAWQPLSGPPQSGGGLALDDNQHRIFTFGGDGTSLVRTMTLSGYPYPWALVEAAGTPPAPRLNGALVYDSAHDRLIAFGGTLLDGTATNDVWSLNLSGTPTWTQLTTTGTAPDPRSDFGACYDPVSGRMFVMGGLDATASVEGNTLYALDLGLPAPAWSAPAQSGAVPSGRSGAPLTVDPVGHRLIVFGGNDGASDLNDEYELNLATYTWTAAPMTGIVPDPRSDHVCVWDRNDNQLVIWGGTAADDSVRVMDQGTREWSSLNWFIGPPVRYGVSLGVYDWQWNRLVVLAGVRSADAYTFWRISPTNYWYWTGPTTNPVGGSMVLDRANARAIVYGGRNWPAPDVISAFWQYAFTSPEGWNGVNTGGVDPPSRSAHLAVWDQARARMLVIAGNDPGTGMTNSVFALTDSADFMNWKGLAPAGVPPTPRIYSSGIYDPVGDRVLLYGGVDASNIRADLHQLTLEPTLGWSTLVVPGGPLGRAGASAIYDEPRHRMILFGGADSVLGNYLNDVWSLSLPTLTWTHLLPTGTPPTGRWKHAAVYDSRRGRMVVFGGREATGDSADVWALSVAGGTPAWSRIVPTGVTPLFRSEAGAVYDSTGDRMLIYGGGSLLSYNTAIGDEDLWSLKFSGGGTTAVFDPHAGVSAVGQAWPNPARGASRLAFSLAHAAAVNAAVYDVAGRQVRLLASGPLGAGPHEIAWDGRDGEGLRVPSGLYFYRVQLGGLTESRKVVLAP